ncbi:MAG: hypothetical protein NV67_04265 [Gammaproteobacteria bacterium (ex Lamellibrachia satsuma)]|nr:MAG: lipid-binding SYLF domain-containing protein [Gammaproteobacteria bacterium (ex Lamellibrachia satsuma)]RRS36983.1 MAG: hypothetical protein NV67_04265 [Gammaproteobacteria bacterium (ex Lamellibrachia satsuma)]
MKKLVLTLVILFFSAPLFADEVQSTIGKFKKAPDTHTFFKNAYGYAVFPTIGKGGIGIGAAHGKGKVFRKGTHTGNSSMTQLSIGFQLGGQAFSQIIFLQDKRAYDEFTGGSFEFSAQASAVALTAGTNAQTSTAGNAAGAGETKQKASYVGGMATFTMAKGGLMYEAAIGGQKFNFKPK